MNVAAHLATSLLFGGMIAYSFGLAPLAFSALPMKDASKLLRHAFPLYCLFVTATSAVAAIMLWPIDPLSAGLMAATTAIALFARQVLTPFTEFLQNRGEGRNSNRAHSLSMALQMVKLGSVATVLVRLAG
jgi:Domain of unknown function (DUF4149)